MIKYAKGYKYQLRSAAKFETPLRLACVSKNRFIELRPNGLLIVRPGYAWDGPSGPAQDTKSFMRGSLAHDALYQLMREESLDREHRKVADELMYRLCREDGMWPPRAKWCLWAVRRFAAKSSREGRAVLSAP